MRTLAILVAAGVTALAVGGGVAWSQHHGPHHGMHQKGHMEKGHKGHGQAQEKAPPPGHQGHGAAAAQDTDAPTTKAFKDINARMHKGMDIAFTGDADMDFVRGMIAHHQGAVEMARVVLEHGKDAEIRKLSEAIIKAQNEEIALMSKWLEARKPQAK